MKVKVKCVNCGKVFMQPAELAADERFSLCSLKCEREEARKPVSKGKREEINDKETMGERFTRICKELRKELGRKPKPKEVGERQRQEERDERNQ